jgi:hypothetical protein
LLAIGDLLPPYRRIRLGGIWYAQIEACWTMSPQKRSRGPRFCEGIALHAHGAVVAALVEEDLG